MCIRDRADNDTTYYVLVENDDFEIGFGTYASNILQRDFVLQSSNSDNKINLGGSGTVFIGYPADKSVFRDGEDQVVVGASGLLFDNGSIFKDVKLVELNDIRTSGTITSSHLISFDVTNNGLLIGDQTGWSSNNTLIGHSAGSGLTTGAYNTIVGYAGGSLNQTGSHNVFLGYKAGPSQPGSAPSVYKNVSVGFEAGNKLRHHSTAIGYQAAVNTYEIGVTALGYLSGSGVGSYGVALGYEAGYNLTENYAVSIGFQAGYNAGGESSIWIGKTAGYGADASVRSVGLGVDAGKSSSGDDCVYIGKDAGNSNSTNNMLFMGNDSTASNGSLLKGDMS